MTIIGDFQMDTKSLQQASRQAQQALGRITGKASEFQKSLDASTARVFAFGATTAVLNGVTRAFNALVSTTVEVEKRLIEINSIFGASTSEFGSFREEIFKVAQNTGQAFSVVADGAAELARQGLSATETAKRLEAALILTRVSGLDSVKAVQSLTAAINGFTSAGLTAEQITNKLVAVDTKFAVSAGDLADGFSRAGSAAEDAGVSFDELLGLITSVQQQTSRGGAVIGNALKSIFTRLSRSSTIEELQALGVAIDASQSGVQKLQALSNALSTISDPTQAAAIKELAGGVYQINIVSAALKDLSKQNSLFSQASQTAANASNEAYSKNAELQKSIAAQINILIQGVTNLAEKIGQLTFAPILKDIIKITTKISEFFNESLSEIDGSPLIKGLFKTIGTFLSGPAVVLFTSAFLKIFTLVARYAKDGFKSVLEIGTKAEKIKNIEAGIVATLATNKELREKIVSSTLTEAQKHQLIIDAIKQENLLLEQQRSLLNGLSKIAYASGARGFESKSGFIGKGGKPITSAAGFVPNFSRKQGEMLERAAASDHGYKAGRVFQTRIHDGNGRSFNSFVNSKEDIVHFKNANGKKATIVKPPNGFGKNTTIANGFASKGFVPNFAGLDLETILKKPRSAFFKPDGTPLTDKVRSILDGPNSPLKEALLAKLNSVGQRRSREEIKTIFAPSQRILEPKFKSERGVGVAGAIRDALATGKIKSKEDIEQFRNSDGKSFNLSSMGLLPNTPASQVEDVLRRKFSKQNQAEISEGQKIRKNFLDQYVIDANDLGGITMLSPSYGGPRAIRNPKMTVGKIPTLLNLTNPDGSPVFNKKLEGRATNEPVTLTNVTGVGIKKQLDTAGFSKEVNQTFAPAIVNLADRLYGNLFNIGDYKDFSSKLAGFKSSSAGGILPAGAEGSIFEAASKVALNAMNDMKTVFDPRDENRPFDLQNADAIRKILGVRAQRGDAKRSPTNEQINSLVKKTINDPVYGPMAVGEILQQRAKSPNRQLAQEQTLRKKEEAAAARAAAIKTSGGGFIPNFAAFQKSKNPFNNTKQYTTNAGSYLSVYGSPRSKQIRVEYMKSNKKGDAYALFQHIAKIAKRAKASLYSDELSPQLQGKINPFEKMDGDNWNKLLKIFPQLRYRDIPNSVTSGKYMSSDESQKGSFKNLEDLKKLVNGVPADKFEKFFAEGLIYGVKTSFNGRGFIPNFAGETLPQLISNFVSSYRRFPNLPILTNEQNEEIRNRIQQIRREITNQERLPLINSLAADIERQAGPTALRSILPSLSETVKSNLSTLPTFTDTSIAAPTVNPISNTGVQQPVVTRKIAEKSSSDLDLVNGVLKVGFLRSRKGNPLFEIARLIKAREIKSIDAGAIIGPRIPDLLVGLKKMIERERAKDPSFSKIPIKGFFKQKELADRVNQNSLKKIQARLPNVDLLSGKSEILKAGDDFFLPQDLKNFVKAYKILGANRKKEEFLNLSDVFPNGLASGFIPNFAALQDAIKREQSAGVPKSAIYVDSSPQLRSSRNPMGMMVANTIDEPRGGYQGINRAKKEGKNPKTYGMAGGFIPNFVSENALDSLRKRASYSGDDPRLIAEAKNAQRILNKIGNKNSAKESNSQNSLSPITKNISSEIDSFVKSSNKYLISIKDLNKEFENSPFVRKPRKPFSDIGPIQMGSGFENKNSKKKTFKNILSSDIGVPINNFSQRLDKMGNKLLHAQIALFTFSTAAQSLAGENEALASTISGTITGLSTLTTVLQIAPAMFSPLGIAITALTAAFGTAAYFFIEASNKIAKNEKEMKITDIKVKSAKEARTFDKDLAANVFGPANLGENFASKFEERKNKDFEKIKLLDAERSKLMSDSLSLSSQANPMESPLASVDRSKKQQSIQKRLEEIDGEFGEYNSAMKTANESAKEYEKINAQIKSYQKALKDAQKTVLRLSEGGSGRLKPIASNVITNFNNAQKNLSSKIEERTSKEIEKTASGLSEEQKADITKRIGELDKEIEQARKAANFAAESLKVLSSGIENSDKKLTQSFELLSNSLSQYSENVKTASKSSKNKLDVSSILNEFNISESVFGGNLKERIGSFDIKEKAKKGESDLKSSFITGFLSTIKKGDNLKVNENAIKDFETSLRNEAISQGPISPDKEAEIEERTNAFRASEMQKAMESASNFAKKLQKEGNMDSFISNFFNTFLNEGEDAAIKVFDSVFSGLNLNDSASEDLRKNLIQGSLEAKEVIKEAAIYFANKQVEASLKIEQINKNIIDSQKNALADLPSKLSGILGGKKLDPFKLFSDIKKSVELLRSKDPSKREEGVRLLASTDEQASLYKQRRGEGAFKNVLERTGINYKDYITASKTAEISLGTDYSSLRDQVNKTISNPLNRGRALDIINKSQVDPSQLQNLIPLLQNISENTQNMQKKEDISAMISSIRDIAPMSQKEIDSKLNSFLNSTVVGLPSEENQVKKNKIIEARERLKNDPKNEIYQQQLKQAIINAIGEGVKDPQKRENVASKYAEAYRASLSGPDVTGEDEATKQLREQKSALVDQLKTAQQAAKDFADSLHLGKDFNTNVNNLATALKDASSNVYSFNLMTSSLEKLSNETTKRLDEVFEKLNKLPK